MSGSIKNKYNTYRGMTVDQLRARLDEISRDMQECQYGDYSYDCLDLESSIVSEVLAEKKIQEKG